MRENQAARRSSTAAVCVFQRQTLPPVVAIKHPLCAYKTPPRALLATSLSPASVQICLRGVELRREQTGNQSGLPGAAISRVCGCGGAGGVPPWSADLSAPGQRWLPKHCCCCCRRHAIINKSKSTFLQRS